MPKEYEKEALHYEVLIAIARVLAAVEELKQLVRIANADYTEETLIA